MLNFTLAARRAALLPVLLIAGLLPGCGGNLGTTGRVCALNAVTGAAIWGVGTIIYSR